MQQQNKKGFLLIDALISVFITSVVCSLCYSTYKAIINYEEGYFKYQEQSNTSLEKIYISVYECEACIIDESN